MYIGQAAASVVQKYCILVSVPSAAYWAVPFPQRTADLSKRLIQQLKLASAHLLQLNNSWIEFLLWHQAQKCVALSLATDPTPNFAILDEPPCVLMLLVPAAEIISPD